MLWGIRDFKVRESNIDDQNLLELYIALWGAFQLLALVPVLGLPFTYLLVKINSIGLELFSKPLAQYICRSMYLDEYYVSFEDYYDMLWEDAIRIVILRIIIFLIYKCFSNFLKFVKSRVQK